MSGFGKFGGYGGFGGGYNSTQPVGQFGRFFNRYRQPPNEWVSPFAQMYHNRYGGQLHGNPWTGLNDVIGFSHYRMQHGS